MEKLYEEDEVIPFDLFADHMAQTGRAIDPREAKVLSAFNWGPFKPTHSAWALVRGALKMAESDRAEREKPAVVRRYVDGCEVFRVRAWEQTAAPFTKIAVAAAACLAVDLPPKSAAPSPPTLGELRSRAVDGQLYPHIVHEEALRSGYTAYVVRVLLERFIVVEHDAERGHVFLCTREGERIGFGTGVGEKQLPERILAAAQLRGRGARSFRSKPAALASIQASRKRRDFAAGE